MIHRILHLVMTAALGCAVSMVPAPAQSTCAWHDGGWGAVGQDDGPLISLADGPIVVMVAGEADAAGRVPSISLEQFTVSLQVGEEEVAGTVTMEAGPNENARRILFLPEEPLSMDLEYELTVQGPETQFGPPVGFGSLTLQVVDEVPPPQPPAISMLRATEEFRPTDQVCCDLPTDDAACVNDGGGCIGPSCDVCWFERHTYPVVAGVSWEFEGGLSNHYDFLLVRTDGSDEEAVGTAPIWGAASVDFAEAWEGERCVRVDAHNVFTGDTITGEQQCVDEFTTMERRAPPERPSDADRCVGPPIGETDGGGETGGESSEPGGSTSEKSAPGCSSVPADAGWLSLLVIGLVRLRRRART